MKQSTSIVDQVAQAVLYEGYILYPYRPSLKNRQRWTFGGVHPRAYIEAHGDGASSIHTECLLAAEREATIDVSVRFLHLVERSVGELTQPLASWPHAGEPAYRAVDELKVGNRVFHNWQEAVEREVPLLKLPVIELLAIPRQEPFSFAADRQLEPIRDARMEIAGVLIRQCQPLAGKVTIGLEALDDRLFKLMVTISNETAVDDPQHLGRDDMMMRSLVSTHAILYVRGGRFVSLLDPPDPLREAAASCRNCGAWPVLVGEPGQTNTMLAAPIILYDYPQVAPESPGDMFDATEIDEILTLRVMTLTEDEKRQMASVEEHARALLQRTDSLGPDAMAALHGTFRGLRPVAGGRPQ